jgi:hypothetical protein
MLQKVNAFQANVMACHIPLPNLPKTSNSPKIHYSTNLNL